MTGGDDVEAVVGVFDDAMRAHVARLALEGAGIDAHVIDEQIVTANPLWGPAVGGVRLVVAAADAAALDVLGRRAEVSDAPACPSCGGAAVRRARGGRRRTFLSLLLLGLPLSRATDAFTCDDCGHTWRQ